MAGTIAKHKKQSSTQVSIYNIAIKWFEWSSKEKPEINPTPPTCKNAWRPDRPPSVKISSLPLVKGMSFWDLPNTLENPVGTPHDLIWIEGDFNFPHRPHHILPCAGVAVFVGNVLKSTGSLTVKSLWQYLKPENQELGCSKSYDPARIGHNNGWN